MTKRQVYRNLSQIGVISHRNGVVNGVVDCSWFGDGDVKYHKEKSVEPHVLAGRRVQGFLVHSKGKEYIKEEWNLGKIVLELRDSTTILGRYIF